MRTYSGWFWETSGSGHWLIVQAGGCVNHPHCTSCFSSYWNGLQRGIFVVRVWAWTWEREWPRYALSSCVHFSVKTYWEKEQRTDIEEHSSSTQRRLWSACTYSITLKDAGDVQRDNNTQTEIRHMQFIGMCITDFCVRVTELFDKGNKWWS